MCHMVMTVIRAEIVISLPKLSISYSYSTVPLFVAHSTFIKHQSTIAARLSILFLLPSLISFTTMLLVYQAIARKLYKQHRAVQPAKNMKPQRKAMRAKLPITPTATATTTRAVAIKETASPAAVVIKKKALPGTATRETQAMAAKETAKSVEMKEITTNPASTQETTKMGEATKETTRTTTATDEDIAPRSPPMTRNLTRPEMTATATSGATANTARAKTTGTPRQESTKQANKRKMHIQALKIYSSIFALFSFSVIMLFTLVFISFENQGTAGIGSFIYFLNHVGNPVIYYALIDTFRREVNAYFRRVLQCCRKK